MSQDHDYIAQLKERIVSLEQRIRTIAVSQSPQPIDALAFFAAHAPEVPPLFGDDHPHLEEVELIALWRWHYAEEMVSRRPSPQPHK